MDFVPCSQCPELAPKGAAACPACGAPLVQEAAAGAASAAAPGDVAPAPAPYSPPPLQPALPPEVQAQARALEEEIQAKPAAKALYLKLAEIYEGAGRRDLAAATLGRLVAIDPANTYVKHRLGLLERPASETFAARTAAALPVPRIAPRVAPAPQRRWPLVLGAVALAAGIAFAAKLLFFPATRRIVALAEAAHAPQWSPTGDRIAFVSDRQGGSFLSVHDLRKRTTREAAAIVAGGADSYAWSPDGQRIAYVDPDERSAWGEAVFVAGVEGATAASRLGAGRTPQWSPDGVSVAYACTASLEERDAAVDEALDLEADSLSTHMLCIASATGGSPRQIRLPAPVRTLAFSPEGSRLVLALDAAPVETAPPEPAEPPDGELVALADGAIAGRPRNVLEGRQGLNRELEARAYDEQRNPRGPGVPPAMTDLFVVGTDGSGLVQLTSDHRSALKTWAADGRIVFIGTLPGGDGAEVASMHPDGSDRQSLFKVPVEAADASAVVPSRDLSRVVFPARVKEANEIIANAVTGETAVDLYLVQKGRSGVRRLANKHPFKQRFALSPNGGRIVYEVRDPKSRRGELWLMRL